jgi:hypothetical protein
VTVAVASTVENLSDTLHSLNCMLHASDVSSIPIYVENVACWRMLRLRHAQAMHRLDGLDGQSDGSGPDADPETSLSKLLPSKSP